MNEQRRMQRSILVIPDPPVRRVAIVRMHSFDMQLAGDAQIAIRLDRTFTPERLAVPAEIAGRFWITQLSAGRVDTVFERGIPKRVQDGYHWILGEFGASDFVGNPPASVASALTDARSMPMLLTSQSHVASAMAIGRELDRTVSIPFGGELILNLRGVGDPTLFEMFLVGSVIQDYADPPLETT